MATASQVNPSSTVQTSGITQTSDIIKVSPDVLVKRMIATNPNTVGKLPEKRVQALVRDAMAALAHEVNGCEEGRLQVPGLGRITIRQAKSDNDSSKQVKRIILSPAKPKAKA